MFSLGIQKYVLTQYSKVGSHLRFINRFSLKVLKHPHLKVEKCSHLKAKKYSHLKVKFFLIEKLLQFYDSFSVKQ